MFSLVGGMGLEPARSLCAPWCSAEAIEKKHPFSIELCWMFSLVGGIGLEPTAFAMSTQRSNQLS